MTKSVSLLLDRVSQCEHILEACQGFSDSGEELIESGLVQLQKQLEDARDMYERYSKMQKVIRACRSSQIHGRFVLAAQRIFESTSLLESSISLIRNRKEQEKDAEEASSFKIALEASPAVKVWDSSYSSTDLVNMNDFLDLAERMIGASFSGLKSMSSSPPMLRRRDVIHFDKFFAGRVWNPAGMFVDEMKSGEVVKEEGDGEEDDTSDVLVSISNMFQRRNEILLQLVEYQAKEREARGEMLALNFQKERNEAKKKEMDELLHDFKKKLKVSKTKKKNWRKFQFALEEIEAELEFQSELPPSQRNITNVDWTNSLKTLSDLKSEAVEYFDVSVKGKKVNAPDLEKRDIIMFKKALKAEKKDLKDLSDRITKEQQAQNAELATLNANDASQDREMERFKLEYEKASEQTRHFHQVSLREEMQIMNGIEEEMKKLDHQGLKDAAMEVQEGMEQFSNYKSSVLTNYITVMDEYAKELKALAS